MDSSRSFTSTRSFTDARRPDGDGRGVSTAKLCCSAELHRFSPGQTRKTTVGGDRKSTRLNSSHGYISYAVFCLEQKNELQSRLPLVCRLLLENKKQTTITIPDMQAKTIPATAVMRLGISYSGPGRTECTACGGEHASLMG